MIQGIPPKKNNWKHRPFHVQHPPAHLPGDVRRQGHHFVGDPAVNLTAVNLTRSHGLEFIKWVGWEAWCDSPANTGEQKKEKKIGALQNACPKFISRPQTQSSCKFVSYKIVGLELSNLYMSNFPQETPQSFFPVPEASAAPIFTRFPS